MSDSPPPRPKPGSLRDRIAAFERPAQPAQLPGPPPPRPKSVGVQWRPKQQQQQQQPEDGDGNDQSTQSSAEGVSSSTAGMSASDARNSIKQGGSLKERMAALQGRGAFGGLSGGGGGGASAPKETSPPPPPTQKPKWKPPPQVAFIPAEGEESPAAPARESAEEEVQAETGAVEENPEQPEQVDPEEEERQRRATIAARMAKLGGARLGMAPPGMFGGARPPPPKKPEALRAPTAKESEAQAGTLHLSPPPPPPPAVPGAEEEVVADTEPADGSSPTPHSRSPPLSMPAPAVPRRTAPPRRKPPKSPIPPTPPEVEPEAEVAQAEPAPLATAEHLEVLADVEPLTKEERREVEVQPVEEVETTQDLVGHDAHYDAVYKEAVVEEPEQQEPEEEEEEKEEDAETRRKRIAERIARMGAINPLAPPPISRGSVSDEVEVTSPPASAHVRRSSVDSVSSVKSGGLAKRSSIGSVASPSVSATAPPIRRSSVDSISSSKSVSSPTGTVLRVRKGSVDSVKEVESAPAAVVGGIPEQDEREEAVDEHVPEEEQVQEEEEEGSNDALAASMILERPPPLEQEAHETVPVLPAPPVDRSSRPHDPQTQFGTSASTHHRGFSGYVTRPPQSDDEREHDNRGSIEQITDFARDESSRASPPPLPISPRTGASVPASLRRRFSRDEDEDDEEEEEEEELRPLPVPHRASSILSSRHALRKEPEVGGEDRQDEEGQEEEQVKHVPPPPTRKVPLPPPPVLPAQSPVGPPPPISADSTPPPYSAPVDDPGHDAEQEQQQALEPGSAHSDAPLVIPPPAAERRLSKSGHVAPSDRPLPHPMSFRQSKPQIEVPQLEIMDDEEGDPIDPSIHTPRRSPGRTSQVVVPAPPLPPPPAPALKVDAKEEEEGGRSQEVVDPNATDMDAARRSTIAERMAKLGGIKFGAAPPVPVAKLPSVPAEEASEAEGYEERKEEVGETVGGEEEKKEVDEEEEERARKERIAAKLAGMGGMRIGMMPSTMGFPSRPPQRPVPPPQVKEEATPVPPPPHPAGPRGRPTRPPPPPQPQEAEWERDSASNSEDGVKVDIEESDMEEVNHEDARTDEDHEDHEDGEMVVPPPPPRVHPRPPVPSTSNIRSSTALGRKSSSGSTTTTKTVSTSPQRTRGNYDFVMVDEPQDAGEEEEQEDVPPPPPVRPPQRRLTREAPSLPPQQSMSDSISSQWELPVIPSGSLGLGTDLSMSWTEADDLAATLIPPTHAPPPPPPIDAHSQMHPTTGQRLSSDELNAVWKRVGVQVCEVAMQLYEKSKKTVVGDGTYAGFVHAVLNEVPNAAKPPVEGHGQEEWGYLVYAQTGSAVQKRMSEIMSGDVVEFIDARFKGHKSPLQTYSQHVGAAGEPVVGVVASEVEPKKTKVKVVQANQHVGQQTVESVSYRLEDLKSGTVKVYRILEA